MRELQAKFTFSTSSLLLGNNTCKVPIRVPAIGGIICVYYYISDISTPAMRSPTGGSALCTVDWEKVTGH